jgi:hypothetical protein
MVIFWSVLIGSALLVALITSIVSFRKAGRHEPRPLTNEDRALCARIIDAGLGRPWICRKAVDRGECPCLPCPMLEKARNHTLVYPKKIA